MIKQIKNADSVVHVWHGQQLQPGEYRLLSPVDYVDWVDDTALQTAISVGQAVMNNGTVDITDPTIGLNFFLATSFAELSAFDNTQGLNSANIQSAIVELIDPHQVWVLSDDFSKQFGDTNFSQATSGGGAPGWTMSNSDSAGNHMGVMSGNTGTAQNGNTVLFSGGAGLVFGQGVCQFDALIKSPVLATTLQDYTIRVGIGSSITGVDNVNGVYFEYARATSTNWLFKTASNSTRTSTTSSTAVVANTWYALKFIVNSGGTNADFYINGSLSGSITTNIPTSAGQGGGPNIMIVKSVGSTAATVLLDLIQVRKQFSGRLT